jgi:hypothetical protein
MADSSLTRDRERHLTLVPPSPPPPSPREELLRLIDELLAVNAEMRAIFAEKPKREGS